jgi:hypothetical protein
MGRERRSVRENINDLADEGTGKLVELTIKYKNLQWSFSCSDNDLSGHDGGGEQSTRPHWHFQVFVDDRSSGTTIFIRLRVSSGSFRERASRPRFPPMKVWSPRLSVPVAEGTRS